MLFIRNYRHYHPKNCSKNKILIFKFSLFVSDTDWIQAYSNDQDYVRFVFVRDVRFFVKEIHISSTKDTNAVSK